MIHNPSSLYSGGSVTLDSTPYMRLAAQERANQQAIQEASFRHYSELPDKLNTAGVRDQDWNDTTGHGGGSIGDHIDKQKQYFLQNSKAIIKGNTPEAFNYSKMHQSNLKDIAASKSLGQEEAKIGQLHLLGKFNPREEDLPVIDNMHKSLFDKSSYKPEGGRYGFNDLSAVVPQFDTKKSEEFDKAVFNGINLQRAKNPDGSLVSPSLDKYGQKVLNKMEYDPQDIYSVGENAAQLVTTDKIVYFGMKDLLKNPDQVKIASEMLSKVIGTPVVAQTPQQMAAGLYMYKADQRKKEQEETNVDEANKFKQKLQKQKEDAQLKRTREIESGKNKRTSQVMGGENIDYPLDKFVDIYGVNHDVKDADNKTISTMIRIPVKSLPQGELERYNKLVKNEFGGMEKEVKPFTDENGDEYFNASTNADGHKELLGEKGKISATESRNREINNIPANKSKQGIYFNKDSKPKSASGVNWK